MVIVVLTRLVLLWVTVLTLVFADGLTIGRALLRCSYVFLTRTLLFGNYSVATVRSVTNVGDRGLLGMVRKFCLASCVGRCG